MSRGVWGHLRSAIKYDSLGEDVVNTHTLSISVNLSLSLSHKVNPDKSEQPVQGDNTEND